MKLKLAIVAVLPVLLLGGCAGMPGTTTGIIGGAGAGAIIDRHNPVGGAIIGGALGGVLGNIIDQNNPPPPRYYGQPEYYPEPQYYPPRRPYYPPQPDYYPPQRHCGPCGY